MKELPLEHIAEYDNAAQWCAQRGLTGKPGDPLPENMGTPGAIEYIQADPESFEERVREFAYANAVSKPVRKRTKPNATDDAERWLINKEISLGRFIHNSSLETCYAQASDFAGAITNTFSERIRQLRIDIKKMLERADLDYKNEMAEDELNRDNLTAEAARKRALGEVLVKLQFHLGPLID
jgi:hypothetical protein